MASTTRILRTTDYVTGETVCDVRRVEGNVLIHLGTIRRDGRQWVATARGATISTGHARQRDAVTQLNSDVAPLA